jgi:hypothetical protein
LGFKIVNEIHCNNKSLCAATKRRIEKKSERARKLSYERMRIEKGGGMKIGRKKEK